MKKRTVVIIIICVTFFLSLSLISTGWFSDLFNNDKTMITGGVITGEVMITGNTIYDGYWCNGSDITQDGTVDGADLSMILKYFNQNCSSNDWCNGSDITQEGVVDGGDLSMILANYNQNCTGEPECTDSDGGLNYYVKGLVTSRGGDESIWDFCNGSVLTELTCDEQGGKAYYYNCPNGCLDGACVNQTGVTCSADLDCGSPIVTRYCSGNLSCTNSTTPTCFNAGTTNSSCMNVAGGGCSSCTSGCEDGYCLPDVTTNTSETPIIAGASELYCYDSDSGIAPYVFGNVSWGGMSVQDFCATDDLLYEYFCNNTILNTTFSCPCSDGKCIASEEWCNGADITLDGIVGDGDLAMILSNYNQNCSSNDWCDGADIDRSGSVTGGDLAILLAEWNRDDCIGTEQGFLAGIWEGIKDFFGF